jgi:hypothetical protein
MVSFTSVIRVNDILLSQCKINSDSRMSLISLVACLDLLPVHIVLFSTCLARSGIHHCADFTKACQERPVCSPVESYHTLESIQMNIFVSIHVYTHLQKQPVVFCIIIIQDTKLKWHHCYRYATWHLYIRPLFVDY